MLRLIRLSIVIVTPLLAVLGLTLGLARAQEPDDWHWINDGNIWWDWDFPTDPASNDYCTDGTDDNCQAVYLTGAYQFDSYQNFYLPVEASAIRINASKSAGGGIDFGVTACGHIGNAPGDYTAHSWTSTITCSAVLTAGWHTVYWANNSSGSNTTVYSITMEYYGAGEEEEGGATCTTVENSDFTISDTTWLLDGGAEISTTIEALILPDGGTASQDVTLDSNTTYNVVISTTETTNSSSLTIGLGTSSQTIEITGAGVYTASFFSPAGSSPISYTLQNDGSNTLNLDYTCIVNGESCTTVLDAHFITGDHWDISGTAAITGSNLTLGKLDEARQNLSLEGSTTYQAVISAATVTDGPVNLRVTLGNSYEILSIPEPGLYTATLTTPVYVPGPLQYIIKNDPPVEYLLIQEPVIEIDYTCLAGGEGGGCIAPVNGSFDTADDWSFYRSAFWDSLNQNANLPYNTGGTGKSLVVSTSAFSLPTVTTGNYLLMRFEAGSDKTSILSSRAMTVESSMEIYAGVYEYETDLSSLAGETVTDLAFANVGDEDGFSAEGDVRLDNICIFVSNEPPALPTPTDLGSFPPANFGFNFTCNDMPGILAAFGINVTQLQAVYDAGVSVWEPQNYIPWLAAALWTNAARPVSCLLVELMRLLAGVVEQVINEFLNHVNWTVRTVNLGIPWVQQGGIYLKNAIFSPAQFSRNTAAGWLVWFSRTLDDLWDGFGLELNNSATLPSNTFVQIWNDSVLPVLEFYVASTVPIDENPNPGAWSIFGFGLLDFLWALLNLVWWLGAWIWENVFVGINLPITFYNGFDMAINSSGYVLVSCSGEGFWCIFLAGVQLLNQLIGHTILYPIIIIGMILSTLYILWDNVRTLYSIEIK